MDAIPALGLSLFALAPGLAFYCAIYGVFGTSTRISTVPRDPKSVEALIVIVLGALSAYAAMLALHDSVALLIPPRFLTYWFDLPRTLIALINAPKQVADVMLPLLFSMMSLCVICYVAVRRIMRFLTHRDRLPYWLFRWTKAFAGQLEDDNALVFCYALTSAEVGPKSIMYVGVVDDLALDDKFDVGRIVLIDCQRFAVDLSQKGAKSGLGKPLSDIPRLVLSGANIRNVSFERIELG